jgi:hypothetical protein
MNIFFATPEHSPLTKLVELDLTKIQASVQDAQMNKNQLIKQSHQK